MEVNKQSSKILIVDDNPVNIDFLVELLKEYDARTVLDGFSAIEAVEEEAPDLILLDITMPGMDGFEVCHKIKSSPKTQNIPIIFLTASRDTESIVKAFKVGGSDYISKPYNTEEVLARLQTHLKLKKALELLAHRTLTDELTGLPNRKHFFRDAKRWIAASQKGIHFTLYILSIKEFAYINQQYGYAVGDEVIKAVAIMIKKVLEREYAVARFGGSDFFLLFHGQLVDEVAPSLDILQEKIAKVRLKSNPKLDFGLEMTYSESHESDTEIEQVIKRALSTDI